MDRVLGFDLAFLGSLALQLLNTIVLTGALSYILYKPVLKFLKNRRDRIENQINDAAKELKEAQEMRATYEEKLKAIEKERASILDEARKRAAEREAQIIQEAKTEADTLKSRAMLEIERERDKVKDDIKVQIIEISSLMASRFVEKNMDQTTGNKLLEDVISDLGDAKWLS